MRARGWNMTEHLPPPSTPGQVTLGSHNEQTTDYAFRDVTVIYCIQDASRRGQRSPESSLTISIFYIQMLVKSEIQSVHFHLPSTKT